MPNDLINVDPYYRKKVGESLISYEEKMKNVVQSLKNRLSEASGHLQDPGSKHYIAEAQNLVEALEKILDGGITECGTNHKNKALQQIALMEQFGSSMKE